MRRRERNGVLSLTDGVDKLSHKDLLKLMRASVVGDRTERAHLVQGYPPIEWILMWNTSHENSIYNYPPLPSPEETYGFLGVGD